MRNITRNYYQDSGYQSLKSDSSYTFDDTKKEATKSENVNVPNNDLMIKFTKLQIIINVISAIILYIPSIISFWIIFSII